MSIVLFIHQPIKKPMAKTHRQVVQEFFTADEWATIHSALKQMGEKRDQGDSEAEVNVSADVLAKIADLDVGREPDPVTE